jgi:hypothetical protein
MEVQNQNNIIAELNNPQAQVKQLLPVLNPAKSFETQSQFFSNISR